MNIKEALKSIMDNKLIISFFIIMCSYIIYNIVFGIINNRTKKERKIKLIINNKSETYLKLISNTLKYVFVIFTILIILRVFNVNVSGMMAGLGIASVVIGLAIQDALKDIIRGFSILSDDYFSVGDVIKYNDIEGVVLVIGLKTTKIRSIISQNIISIANRNVEKIEIVSSQLDIEIPLSYGLSKSKAEKVIDKIVCCLKERKEVIDCEYKGINKLDDSSINYLIRISCDPETKPQTRRNCIGDIMSILEKDKIEIPFKQIDFHTK